MDIQEFLLARIAEDERAARKLAETDRRPVLPLAMTVNHPERTLAECRAKRAIIALADDVDTIDDALMIETMSWKWGTAEKLLDALAAVYSDHPDYQRKWSL